MNVLIVNFTLEGISEEQYQAMCDDVAPAFAAVPGLASKVWLADREAGIYGGVYMFESAEAAEPRGEDRPSSHGNVFMIPPMRAIPTL